MVIGYRVEYAWWHYPVNTLAIHKKYVKTMADALALCDDILSRHYHRVRIVPIRTHHRKG
jgi:hypothetical protein